MGSSTIHEKEPLWYPLNIFKNKFVLSKLWKNFGWEPIKEEELDLNPYDDIRKNQSNKKVKKLWVWGDYGKAKLGDFRVVRIKIEQVFFVIFGVGRIILTGKYAEV